jgi:hypothetical protein
MTDLVFADPTLSFGARTEVPPPPYVPRPYDLFSVAPPQGFGDQHEQNGVYSILQQYADVDGDLNAYTYGDGCDPADDRTKTIVPGLNVSQADKLEVYAGYRCAPVAFTEQQRMARAVQALELGEEQALETAILTGQTTNGVAWTSPFQAANVDATTHVAVAKTFGDVEHALAEQFGGRGVIGVPVTLFEYLYSFSIVRPEGDVLYTPMRNKAFVYAAGATEALDGSVPVVYCGALEIRRGDVFSLGDFTQSFDKSNNDLVHIVERGYVLHSNFPAAA